jgi:hypothetical protein
MSSCRRQSVVLHFRPRTHVRSYCHLFPFVFIPVHSWAFLRNFRPFFILYQADPDNHESTRIHTNGIGPDIVDNGVISPSLFVSIGVHSWLK